MSTSKIFSCSGNESWSKEFISIITHSKILELNVGFSSTCGTVSTILVYILLMLMLFLASFSPKFSIIYYTLPYFEIIFWWWLLHWFVVLAPIYFDSNLNTLLLRLTFSSAKSSDLFFKKVIYFWLSSFDHFL